MTENEHLENAEDIIVPFKKKKHSIVWKIILAVIILIAGYAGYNFYQNTQIEKNFYQVQSGSVISNIRIICLSDLHMKEFGNKNERLIKTVEDLNPDIIAIVGDMNLESKPNDYEVVTSLCKSLNSIAPVYYSLGNHELDAMLFGDSNIYDDLKAAGIKIFNNESETVEINGTPIDIIGLTQGPESYYDYGAAFFDKVMNETDNFKLLLNHYPENFLGIIEEYNIDLALCGHAHGGQVRLPGIGGLYAADQGFLPKLCDGYHEIENSKVIITRGLGSSGVVPRINNKPEIAIVDVSWY